MLSENLSAILSLPTKHSISVLHVKIIVIDVIYVAALKQPLFAFISHFLSFDCTLIKSRKKNTEKNIINSVRRTQEKEPKI